MCVTSSQLMIRSTSLVCEYCSLLDYTLVVMVFLTSTACMGLQTKPKGARV